MASQRLINSTEELKSVVGAVQSDLVFEAIQSFVDDAEINHIIPAIGYPLYDALREPTTDIKKIRALMLLRKAVANFAIHYYVAFGSVQISESGIFVTKTDRVLPASDKKTLQLRLQSRADGFKGLEAAIIYLESNLNDFAEYANDVAHAQNTRLYTNTCAEFSQGFDLHGNVEAFTRFKFVIETVEQNYIDNLLGSTLTTALRSAVLNNTASADQKKLLAKIARVTPLLTVAEAIPYRLVEFDNSGMITSSIVSNGDNVEASTAGDMKRLQALMNATLQKGLSQLAILTKWLNDNAGLFPGYATSDLSANSKLNDEERGVYFI
ncbi:hypothetical protein GCM10023149_30800 [Mucilaginibacter gynuensis]|uniref:Uncharacterized protein n=1 Tax=Mucilaginibacter gynuensis TaxID=1302236 RepID=A0ABP8GN55_9SPHI